MTEKYIRLDDVMTIIARKHLFKDKTDFDKCVHAIAEQIKALPTVEAVPLSVIEDIKAEIKAKSQPKYDTALKLYYSEKVDVLEIIDRKVNEVKGDKA